MAIPTFSILPTIFSPNLRRIAPYKRYRQIKDTFVKTADGKIQPEEVHTLKMANGKEQKIPIACADAKKKAMILEGIQRCLDKNIEIKGLKFECSPLADSIYDLGFTWPFKRKAVGCYISSYDANENSQVIIWHGTSWNPFSRNYSLLAAYNQILHPIWGKHVYSGAPSHLVLHEIGHHLHRQELQRLSPYRGFLDEVNNVLGQKLEPYGHPFLDFQQAKDALLERKEALFDELFESHAKPEYREKLSQIKNLLDKASKLEAEDKPFWLSKDEATLILKQMGHPHFIRGNGKEFVAEMFASMMGGKKFSPEMMALYHKFHGPVPPGGF